jgi:type III pantothenate kinase
MKHLEKALVIDAGNTRIKVAIFQHSEIQLVRAFSNDQLSDLKNFLIGMEKIPAIIASVRSENNTKWLHRMLPKALRFSSKSILPIQIAYETPNTLGVDRIANAVAAHYLAAKKNALVIDIGTCIKYDFVDQQGSYLGGGISPGIALRYQAMHTFTGKLPLIEDTLSASMIGKNTFDAMRSGVMNGMMHEMNGFIEEYRSIYAELTIFLTGGDHQYFDLGLKNGIFADENLTLKGLQIVLAHAHA